MTNEHGNQKTETLDSNHPARARSKIGGRLLRNVFVDVSTKNQKRYFARNPYASAMRFSGRTIE